MKFKIFFPIIVGQLIASVSSPAQSVSEWQIVGAQGDLMPNTLYRLRNNNPSANSFLAHWVRNVGINMAFNQDQQQPNIKFVKEDGSNTPIKTEDKLAIYVTDGGYLDYEKREFGVNIRYLSYPVFQWVFRDNSFGPQNPKTLKGSEHYSLFNGNNNGYLVYSSRDFGPNLDWAEKPNLSLIFNESETFVESETHVALSLKAGPFQSSSLTGRCSGRVIWTFIPLTLTSDKGKKDKTFVIDKYYETAVLNTRQNEWWCFYTEGVVNMRAGTWKIVAQTSNWTAECDVNIQGKNSQIQFELNKAGCVNAFAPQLMQPSLKPQPKVNDPKKNF